MAQQLSFLPKTKKIVNVASVPLRSPFRYPGGKTWLVPEIRRWLSSLPGQSQLFIEPFAGGGIVGLTVAFEELANHVLLVELDEDVSAVWETIIYGEAAWLAQRILDFDLDSQSVDEILNTDYAHTHEHAFKTIIKNRVNRGGILAPGAGKVKDGENGKGLRSRWYPQTLAKRIRHIASIRDRLDFIRSDGMQVIETNLDNAASVLFIDPPYTAGQKKAGRRLYRYSDLDHPALFRLCSEYAGDFIMTYSNDPAVHALAKKHSFDTREIAMKNTHHAKMTELLIGRDLGWYEE